MQAAPQHRVTEIAPRNRVVVVHHLGAVVGVLQQAARVADYAAFFLGGELIEYTIGKRIFTNPLDSRTEDYVEGRFG